MGFGMNTGAALRGSTGSGMGEKTPKGYKAGRLANFTPEQMQLFQQIFSQVSPDSFTGKLASGDEDAFQQMEAPAYRDFAGVQGNIASRFSGMGLGGRKSSGFQNTINAASSNFAQDLQSRRVGLQQQAIKDLHSMSSDLLGQRPYENYLVKKEKPWWQELLNGVGNTAVKAGVDSLIRGPGGGGGIPGSAGARAY
jgi:hypothetical protein